MGERSRGMFEESEFADGERFWTMPLDEQTHLDNLDEAVRSGMLTAVVDGEAGGIIAYAVGDHDEMIVAALRAAGSAKRR